MKHTLRKFDAITTRLRKFVNVLRDPFVFLFFKIALYFRVRKLRLKPGLTVVITSAGRLPYLEKTISTLRRNLVSDALPIRYHIIDDYPSCLKTRSWIEKAGFDLFLFNQKNVGLGQSLNRIYLSVETEYVLHCEDDWLFLRPIDIASILALLEKPGISQVLLARDDGRSEKAVEKNFYSFNPHFVKTETVLAHFPFRLFRCEKRWSKLVRLKSRNVLVGSNLCPVVQHIGAERTGLLK